jgi:DNA excision repair protein ERCC-4
VSLAPSPTPRQTLIVDTREKTPWDFGPDIDTVRRKLDSGDYSVEGLEGRCVVERKSLSDFLGTLTTGRERFERELERLARMDRACIIVEAVYGTIIEGTYRSTVRPQAVVGSIASFHARFGIPTIFAGNARNAMICGRAFLLKCAKHLGPAVEVAS